MTVKFNDRNASERRKHAEVLYITSLRERKIDINNAVSGMESAIISKFPNLFEPKPVAEISPITVNAEPVISPPIVTEVKPAVQSTPSDELSERRNRILAAQESIERAHEIPA